MAEHRVPVLSGSLHRYVDPSQSSDPRVRELVAALGTLQIAPLPRAHFRAELRAQLVAVAPRLVAEGPADLIRHTPQTVAAAEKQASPSRVRELTTRLPHLRLGRPVRFITAALTIVALAMSGAVWLSRSALPGDPLYGLKRASESAQFSLTTGNIARSKELLAFAKTRTDEAADLLSHANATGAGPQASGTIDDHTASLVTSTLGSSDDDVRQAAQLLGLQAVHDKSATALNLMTAWAPGQHSRLTDIVARIPNGALHDRAATSAVLVAAALARAQGLQPELRCNCLENAKSDSLGPVPCTVCSQPAPTQTQQPGNQSGGGSTSGTNNKTGTTGTGTAGTTPSGTGTGTATTPNPALTPIPGESDTPGIGNPLPTLPLPSLPLPSVTLPSTPPLTADSCGVHITLGPIGFQFGTCGVHVHI
jgi:hypothetical protein